MRSLLALLALLALAGCPSPVKPPSDTSADSGTWSGGDEDGDGYRTSDGDCDDGSAGVNPAAEEVCDGLDNDCDGHHDADDDTLADGTTWYLDADGDGFGGGFAQTACEAPEHYVENTDDCNDTDATVSPDSTEVCNSRDDDCDDAVDEDVTDAPSWYADRDLDGYGDPSATTTGCDAPEGHVADGTDCDDTDPGTNPGAPELCNGVDDDCDGRVDADATDAATWYVDGDTDGFGDPSWTLEACDMPIGYTVDDTDCDDTLGSVNPAAPETCNDVDDDCDGTIDDDPVDPTNWYADTDGDGFGDVASTTTACDVPAGFTSDATDCDDADATANPTGTEVCDGADNDCDGTTDNDATDGSWYVDSDGDGYGEGGAAYCDDPGVGWVENDDDVCIGADDGVDEDGNGVPDGCDSEASGELIGQWTFEATAPDESTGNWVGALELNGATESGGQLVVTTAGTSATGWARMGDFIGTAIGSKTLVSWVSLDDLSTASGSALTLDSVDADAFDGIVYGERVANRWMAGSTAFARTTDVVTEDEVEVGELLQLAISYAVQTDGTVDIEVCRDGNTIGSYTSANAETWDTDEAEVVFGMRHYYNWTATGPGGLDAHIGEARIYRGVLSCAEVGVLLPEGEDTARATVDVDADWYTDASDCDEGDSSVNPGEVEACDGVDNDCDATIDDGGVCPCDAFVSGSTTYQFCEIPSTWEDAESYCLGLGAYDLAAIGSAAENTAVTDEADALGWVSGFWAGGNDIATEQTWVWSSGEAFVYTNWYAPTREPNNAGGEDCMGMRYYGDYWNDWDCSTNMSFVCESL